MDCTHQTHELRIPCQSCRTQIQVQSSDNLNFCVGPEKEVEKFDMAMHNGENKRCP